MGINELLELRHYWDEITTILVYVVAIASVIVRFTPTLKDDAVLLKIVKFLSKWVAWNRKTKDDIIRSKKG